MDRVIDVALLLRIVDVLREAAECHPANGYDELIAEIDDIIAPEPLQPGEPDARD